MDCKQPDAGDIQTSILSLWLSGCRTVRPGYHELHFLEALSRPDFADCLEPRGLLLYLVFLHSMFGGRRALPPASLNDRRTKHKQRRKTNFLEAENKRASAPVHHSEPQGYPNLWRLWTWQP